MSNVDITGLDPIAVGAELGLGQVGRENRETKARRYLIEGRLAIVYVGPDGVRAWCRGSEVYRVEYQTEGGWTCTCPARSKCSHVIAAQSVVVVSGGGQ